MNEMPNWKAFNLSSLFRHGAYYAHMLTLCTTELATKEYMLKLNSVNAEIECRMSKLRGTPNGPR